MQQLKIKNFGPISYCSVSIKPFNVVTGKQSSGKSTIAKCLFFFLNLKDDLYKLYEQYPYSISDSGKKKTFAASFRAVALSGFQETFGNNTHTIKEEFNIRMDYSDHFYVSLTFRDKLRITYSNSFRDFLIHLERKSGFSPNMSEGPSAKDEINQFFQIEYSTVYIPAGRSIMTVMGNQFSLFYSTLNDHNKRLIDLCSRKFFETVMRLKPLFDNGFQSMLENEYQEGVFKRVQQLIQSVMNGEYHYSNGNEYLLLHEGQKIGVNYASSGQQEALWIYNILLYYLLIAEKTFFIIEEPESNLFPESQSYITKFLGFVANNGFPMLINTHSPYVLGELNNLTYAGSFTGKKKKKAERIIEKECQLEFHEVQALFIEDGVVSDCMDYEIEQIDNSKLDSISSVINNEYDALLDVERN